MSIKYDISVEPNYVYLHCTGTYSFTSSKRLIQNAVDAALGSDRSKILIDANGVTGRVTTMQRYDIVLFVLKYMKAQAFGKISQEKL